MRVLPLELPSETVEALEVERELLGFESRGAYVRWLLEHRATVEVPGDDERTLLETYRERLVHLERREAATDEGAEDRESPLEETDACESRGWRRAKSDPTVRVRGSPRRTVVADSTTPAGDPDTDGDDGTLEYRSEPSENTHPEADADGAVSTRSLRALERAHDVIDSMNLTPERVERIREDRVAADAGSLGSVETNRLDELSRRAVAKTRTTLGRNVQTGLSYTSSSDLAGSDVRPGEDVVDLETLSVPGRSADLVERRRELAGRAVAFLRDAEQARRADFVEALYEEYSAGYETVDSWWRCVKVALKQVESVEGGAGSRVWRFRR
ncbi:hypothetical protein [Natronobiforma cellulositropha]|uniref:hypothetical protein n=1 Tax=Natronobiforma cellulositropha TaxID=1679076 RepID=UPI0021D609C8|nr:hypothetical protein [Natronobiforma cellulositropha]